MARLAFEFLTSSGSSTDVWSNSGLTWTADPGLPKHRHVLRAAVTTQTQSTDATLSGLAATSSTSASGAFTSLNIGTFASGTTAYTASVANSVTHAKLTPTVNDSGATVTVAGHDGRQRHGQRRHRAQRGEQRAVGGRDGRGRHHDADLHRDHHAGGGQSSNANLSGLVTATTSTSSTGSFTALTLSHLAVNVLGGDHELHGDGGRTAEDGTRS